MQRHEGKIDRLDKRPDRKAGFEAGKESVPPLLDRVGALHNGHGCREAGQVDWREQTLVRGDPRGDCAFCAAQDNPALQEAEPGCSSRAKDCWTVISVCKKQYSCTERIPPPYSAIRPVRPKS